MLEKFKYLSESSTEGLLKSILDSAFNGIMTLKAVRSRANEIIDFEWLFLNDVAAEIIGKTSELEGSRLLEKMPDYKKAGLFEKFKRVVETGELITFEYNHGETKTNNQWFRISAVKLDDGLTVTFQDISDLREAVIEIESREKKYRKLFEESIDAIFIINDNFKFLESNPSFQKLFHYGNEEITCASLRALFDDDEPYNLFKKILLKKNKVDDFEVTLVDQRNQKKSCLINCVSILDEENKTNNYLGVIRDITKRIEADRELRQAEKLSMTGQIARSIAHEIRNPLTNLSLAMEQLRDEVSEEVEDAELYFKIIKRNADRIGKLITDLLNSSKPKELNLVSQSLNEVVKQAISLVSDRMKLQNMSLDESYADNLSDIPLDTDQLKIALSNLFINAIEAMKPERGKLWVSTELKGQHILLTVRDNGVGISKKNVDRLFEPFFTSKKEGAGLGLTAVQNIIHSHKANIEVESEVGKGTSFRIFFNTSV